MSSSLILILTITLALSLNQAYSWKPNQLNSHQKPFLFPRGGDISQQKRNLVLLIDVDNTLYSEKELASNADDNLHPWQRGIESQIVRNTHLFGLKYFNLTSHQCDELYQLHGSTIEGIRRLLPEKDVESVLARFYKEVYDPIDYTCLLSSSSNNGRSGYDHGNALQKRRDLADFLRAVATKHTVYLSSNSPKKHVLRVLNGMGLRDVPFAGILTPDSVESQQTPFPTKSSPFDYYHKILPTHPMSHNDIILLDDSLNNIRAAQSVGIRGVHIGDCKVSSARSLEEGLAEALGHILPSSGDEGDKTYAFSDVNYLRAKNKVDFDSINPGVWTRLAQELAIRMQQKRDLTFKIADLGAGMLSMLELILFGGGSGDREKLSLLALIHANIMKGQKNYDDPRTLTTHLEYYAYETNVNLFEACKERLHGLGFEEHTDKGETMFHRLVSLQSPDSAGPDEAFHPAINVEVTVHLRSVDFNKDTDPPTDLDLIIGCCFADLFNPEYLTQSLLKLVSKPETQYHPAPLVYFPITFTGTTQFSPPHPSSGMCPSDTSAFNMYSESLVRHGHNLDPSKLIDSIKNHGGLLVAQGQSKWIIDPELDAYLWETMLYFFGMTGGREILRQGLDSVGWIERCRGNKRKIIVSNTDLLFSLQRDEKSYVDSGKSETIKQSNPATVQVQEIQFIAPYKVTTINKEYQLGPNQVEIESLCSLISSGTELKIFKGMFESAALDVNIKGMSDESMEYPLAYGYSLVGRVVACGAQVEDAESIIGKLVFVFSPHSSRVVIDRDAIQLVPDGIEAEDAIFMPSVETALSLVHDANVRVGENVAVFGQGLIGLLVTSILSMQSVESCSSQCGSVTAFDTIDDRLGASSMMGATNALYPQSASAAGPFDVSIEVSGNPRALQSAIDNTSDNGRIIVGSWYGNSDVTLKLGIDFHRSHKTIQTSQVSTIPCTMSGLWSKERRFALTWALVRAIRPSRLISVKLGLDDAQQAYELLDKGQEIAVCFAYK